MIFAAGHYRITKYPDMIFVLGHNSMGKCTQFRSGRTRSIFLVSFSTDQVSMHFECFVAKCLYVGDREWQRQCRLPFHDKLGCWTLEISSEQCQMDYVILSRGWDVTFNDYAHGLLLMLRHMKFDSDVYYQENRWGCMTHSKSTYLYLFRFYILTVCLFWVSSVAYPQLAWEWMALLLLIKNSMIIL